MIDVVLAVDGGNSKTDVALVAPDGAVLAALRGTTVSHQACGLDEGMRRLAALVACAHEDARKAGAARVRVVIGTYCLAGADLPSDVRLLRRSIESLRLAGDTAIRNDTEAILRGGTDEGWGIGIVCGAGVNAIGVAPDGRVARFAGLGDISGDHGAGGELGMEALGAAVRASDGRGPHTTLERLVPQHFGLRRPADVTRAAYEDRISHRQIGELAPVAFAAAADGDPVAVSLVEQLAEHLATWAVAAAKRLRLVRAPVPVVLGGGVARGAGEALRRRVDAHVRPALPNAVVTVLAGPPVLGAALLGLDRVAPGDRRAATVVRDQLVDERLVRRPAV